MPANLTPEYFRAEEQYRQAKTPAEKLAALEEMLRTIPKHKGTDKLQADLKRRISQARKAAMRKKAGGRDPFHVDPQGAGQVVLLGVPNVGKSSLVGALTDAPVKVTEYPFGTHVPVPGMARFEDVQIQLVDMPPITAEHVPPGLVGALRNADILMIVVDLSRDEVLDDLETCLNLLAQRGMRPLGDPAGQKDDADAMQPKRTLVACNKCDVPGAEDRFAALQELYGARLRLLEVSARNGDNLEAVPRILFELLDVIRVYAKPPGKPPDLEVPFVLPRGSTVRDMAEAIHRELAKNLKKARIWGEAVFAGQQVHHEHVLHDKDVVELHM